MPHIPQRCLDDVLQDDVFAASYDSLTPLHRAWLKKLAAETHAVMAPSKQAMRREDKLFRQGFTTSVVARKASGALLFIDSGITSPVQVAAAALPPIFCGAGEVAAIRVKYDGNPADPILAALEICGVENVFVLNERDAGDCLREALADRDCACLCLGGGDWYQGPWRESGALTWRRREAGEMAVLAHPGSNLDFGIMAWAHPGARFQVYGGGGEDLPAGFTHVSGGIEALLETSPDVVFSSISQPWEAASRVPLILGPGQEGCFFWPELTSRCMDIESLEVRDESAPGHRGGA